MKTKFYTLVLLFALFSCSSDDEVATIPIEINAKDIVEGTSASPIGGYYSSGGVRLFVTYHYWVHDGVPLMSCDIFCPRSHLHEHEGVTIYPYIFARETSDDELYFKCPACEAEFDYSSGKARNDKAKGYTLNVYKTEYDRNKEIYTVWK